MNKEKLSRKKSVEPLPKPPPDPSIKQPAKELTEPFKRIVGYKDREREYLNFLKSIRMDDSSAGAVGGIPQSDSTESMKILYAAECEDYVMPLINRTGPSVAAALATEGALDQLDKLHGLLHQLLSMQEQNSRMRRNVSNLEVLTGLKRMHRRISKNPQEFIKRAEDDISDPEQLEMELEQYESQLDTMLAAGRSASSKRNNSKRQRSKSVLYEDLPYSFENKPYPLRRQSAVTDIKAKVSKWTKVKAAFKWERANDTPVNVGKSTDSGIGLQPINNEIARYLRVPSVPCSGDSALSSLSGHIISGPPTPGTISSSSSIDDMCNLSEENRRTNRDSIRSESRSQEDDARRSRSLDGDMTLGASSVNRQYDKTKNKTPWRKVKDIIQVKRGSFKGKSRNNSIKSSNSRDVSPCESIDFISNYEHTESNSSNQQSPIRKTPNPALMLTSPSVDIIGTWPIQNTPIGILPSSVSSCDDDGRLETGAKKKNSRKVRAIITNIPEGVPFDGKTIVNPVVRKGRPPPSPLTLRQDSNSDAEFMDPTISPILQRRGSKWSKVKNAFLTYPASVPNSPSQHMEFFTEFESEELSSGDFSEPTTPSKKNSPSPNINILYQREEIERRYIELKEKLNQEFEVKQNEWEKIRTSASMGSVPFIKEESTSTNSRPISLAKQIGEDNLSPDFKKKLHEWRVKKQQSVGGETKKIDWNLWKSGQIKLEGQGLIQLPDEKDLPEKFQKKLDEWKKIKATNSRPIYQDPTLKRHSLKGHSVKTETCHGSKKWKQSDDVEKELQKIEREKQRLEREKTKCLEREKAEKLLKLKKAVVAEPPSKEVVVRTAEGLLKFEGISRKFTRKLFEWEKSKGIGPELSTFALLYPGYRPITVENGNRQTCENRERTPGLTRSKSMDSVSINASTISHQPSSLSLNDADDIKEMNNSLHERLGISSNPELDDNPHDEPEAVIVEVEDDIIEMAAPLLPNTVLVEPVYHYERARNDLCAEPNKSVVLRKSYSLTEDETSIQVLRNISDRLHHVKNNNSVIKYGPVLENLMKFLPLVSANVKLNSPSSFELLADLVEELLKMITRHLAAPLEESECNINSKTEILQNLLKTLCKKFPPFDDDLPAISITPATARSSIQQENDSEDNIATISITPTFIKNEVVVSSPVQILDDLATTNKHNDLSQTSRNQISEQDVKKIARSVSNGAKRKIKRRLGSRQNSKTESDSDDETQNFVLEAPRKGKRKTSRAKLKPTEIDKQEEMPQIQPEDIVYVLKICPGQKIEQTEVSYDFKPTVDESVLISPTETCVELIDGSLENIPSTNSIFVKTKRKIFTPVDGQSSVIGREVESSSASDKNEPDNQIDFEKKIFLEKFDDKKVKNLPPLPQSPSTQRRLEQQKTIPPKEPSPSIRMMIAKYNQRLTADRINSSPISSGSCSPVAWRSPVLERRGVKAQTVKYQEKLFEVTKSASVGSLRKQICLLEKSNSCTDKDLSRGVLKSSSAGILPADWKDKTENQEVMLTTLAYDSLKRKDSDKINSKKIIEEPPKKDRLYKKRTESPSSIISSKTGAIKKILNPQNYDLKPDKSDNTIPRITRKYDSKPPSPRFAHQHLDLDLANTSFSAPASPNDDPKTPLSERALKLQIAKEEFLSMPSGNYKKDVVWNNRLSQISANSESSIEDGALKKSSSVGTIGLTQIDNHHEGGYVSLPRNTERPNTKTPSRFGFSTLASKLRKVKLRKSSKELNTVSRLCRQSLVVDLVNDPDQRRRSYEDKDIEKDNEPIKKSGSIQFTSKFRKNDKNEKLKKSTSISALGKDNSKIGTTKKN